MQQSKRDAATIQRAQWVLPLLIAMGVAALELLRTVGYAVPGGGAVIILAIIYTAYRGGILPAVIGAGCLAIYMVRGAEIGFQIPPFVLVFVLFGIAILSGWLSDRQHAALADAVDARESSQRSEQRYRDLVNGLDATVWEADADTFSVRFVSMRAENMFGYSVGEWVGSAQIWKKLIHPEDFDRTVNACQIAVEQMRDHDLEYRAVTRSGEILYIRDVIHIDNTVSPPILRGILLDVTAERVAKESSKETERKLRAFINNAPDALVVSDGKGRIVEVNRRATDALGYTREEMLTMKVGDVAVSLTRGMVSGYQRLQAMEPPITSEGIFRRKDGTTFPVEVSVSVWESGEPNLFIATARDITRKTQLETQLRQSQRMEAVGRLAGGIAHDFNNLLTAIKGNADLLISEQGGAPGASLEEIVEASDRAAALTRQLLAYSRQQVMQLQPIDLNTVVGNMQKLLARLIGEDISLVTTLDRNVAAIEADRTQLEQVLMNLVLNARDAMPDGGRISIRTANAILTEVDADRRPFVIPGNYVMLSVTDDGVGMDAETVSRIFDPFFTTKAQGKGSGLGLATAYGIVKQMEGYIWCDSVVGEGTTFRVYLRPTTAEVEPETKSTEPRVAFGRGNETILLVEDEPAVRSLVRRVLVKSGYHVIDAANGVEALRLVETFVDPIHLLLTDVVMPEMGGRDLADRLGPQRPHMKILYMSGYAEDAIVINHVLQPGFAFLPKPFAPDALAAKVREALES